MEIKLIRDIEDLDNKVFVEIYKLIEKDKYESVLLVNSIVSFIDTVMFSGTSLVEKLLIFTMKDPERIFSIKESNGKYSISMDDSDFPFNYECLNQDEALKKLCVLRKRQAI